MAVTVTYDARMQGNKSFLSASAQGKKITTGTLAFPTYAGSGVTCTFGGFNNVEFVMLPNVSGYMLEYHYASTVMLVRYPTASVTITGAAENDASIAQEIASDTALASWSAVQFCVIGD